MNQQDLSLMLLANDLLSKAVDMRCSDLQIEPGSDQVTLRYVRDNELVKEMELPLTVHTELVFCYKVLAGLNIKDATQAQEHDATIDLAGKHLILKVTTTPGEFGETVAVKLNFSE